MHKDAVEEIKRKLLPPSILYLLGNKEAFSHILTKFILQWEEVFIKDNQVNQRLLHTENNRIAELELFKFSYE